MYTYIYRNWRRRCGVSKRLIKITILLMFLLWSLIWIIIYYFKLNPITDLTQYLGNKFGPVYLVNSLKCRIVNLNPFNEDAMTFYHKEDYEPCSEESLLTYITKTNNVATLHINDEAIRSYAPRGVVCCYSNVTKVKSLEDPDNSITMTECQMFGSSVSIYHDTIYVRCFSREDIDIVYENTHFTFLAHEDIREKIEKPRKKREISVLLIGIDSTSRLNFIRTLPNTYKYIKSSGWIPLKGYNKINDHIHPNLIPLLTGLNDSDIDQACDPSDLQTFDQCPMLWDYYKALGYITSYAEDECSMSTFNYNKKGFNSSPTDFYLRPYMLASEKLRTKKKQGMAYCSGPETSGERIMNLAKHFAVAFKDHPHFGLFWMNTFSQNQLNGASGMDNKIKEFLETLSKENVLESSVVIFFSDHGIQFGGLRLTETGWLEERLPFMFVSFPSWFKKTFAAEYNNFETNSVRLTSPYDLHMTLQHFLVLSGHDYIINQSPGCPTCRSLLEEVDKERSCEEAGIQQHWCTCSEYTHIELNEDFQNLVTTYVLNEIYKIIASYEEGWMCARYFVNNITTTSISKKLLHSNNTFLLLKFETIPEAVFETTINYKGDISNLNFSIAGPISRLDRYFTSSDCVTNAELKKYCYCLE